MFALSPFISRILLALVVLGTSAGLAVAAPSPNELVPNGSFEQFDPQGKPENNVAYWWVQPPGNGWEVQGENHVLRVKQGYRMVWERPGKAIGNVDYVYSFRVKGENLNNVRLALWAQLPDKDQPPAGPKFTKWLKGTFDWQTVEIRFRMPENITRFTVFFDGFDGKSTAWFDDFSMRPVDDAPLELDLASPSYGLTDREQLAWIWSEPGFPWSGKMNKEAVQKVPAQEVWFRRNFTYNPAMREPQAVFIGDDEARFLINGREVAYNDTSQNIVRLPLAPLLKPGANQLLFKVRNDKGPAGLLARIEWKDAAGLKQVRTTNSKWESSTNQGANWKAASLVTVPAPAPTRYHWVYPHLKKLAYTLNYPLPPGVTGVRLAIRATGSFRVLADGKEVLSAASSGQVVKNDLSERFKDVKSLSVAFEDIEQPPAGQALLQIQRGAGTEYQNVSLSNFKTEANTTPEAVQALYPERTWPINIGAFEAAASRPMPDFRGRLEPWAQQLVAGATKLFQIGVDDDSSAEFKPLNGGTGTYPVSTPAKDFPRGLEEKLCPEVSLRFSLATVPAQGAAFLLDVEDTDSITNSAGVFVNGIFCGNPQIIGYDQIPGVRLTNRTWVVTIPKERFQIGENTLTLRLLTPYYRTQAENTENQAEEYIQMLNLRERKENPYPTAAWLHWDALSLVGLASASEFINGRPIWMGTNQAYMAANGAQAWRDYVVRDLTWLGLAFADSPIRVGIANGKQLREVNATETWLPEGTTSGDFEMSAYREKGMRPYLLLDSGLDVETPEDLPKSHAVQVLNRYGQYFDMMEIGNEVDNPYYNWDALKLSMAYANIQRQAAVGQMLKAHDPDKNLRIMGEGWYHAWDFGVIDAQARQETQQDVAFTDHLSAHDYGRSYIVPATTYYKLYGNIAPKPIWVTEGGAYTTDDAKLEDFDLNLRGNIAFANYVVQYLAWPYSDQMRRFSMFSAQSKDARVLEKARNFRRLFHAYAQHGQPLAWQFADAAAMKDKLVLVNPVDAGKAYKISLVNFSREGQTVDVNVTLPKAGLYGATRLGDGETVAAGTREVTLLATPQIHFQEMLAPGETVEYLVQKTPLAAVNLVALQIPPAAQKKLTATDKYTWKNVALGGGGFVTGVYIHPKSADAVYIRTDVGGSFRWNEVHTAWEPMMEHFTRAQSNFYGTEALAIDPNDADVLYMAAGKYIGDWAGKGSLFKSTDRGRTWKQLPLQLPMGGNEDKRWGGERLAVDPLDSNTVIFGSRTQGLWKSADAGVTWKQATFPGKLKVGIGIVSVLFDDKRPGVLYANAYGDGIYQSSDRGTTWKKLEGSPKNALRLALANSSLIVTTEAAPAGAVAPGPMLSVPSNGSMTAGEAAPQDWTVTFGNLKVIRDTIDFQQGPAALQITTGGQAGQGTVGSTFDAPTVPFRASGFVKTAGTLDEAQVALQVFDKNWKQLDWVVLSDARTSRDWARFNRDITLPAGAAKCILLVSLKGNGQAWLDEIQCQRLAPANQVVEGYGVVKFNGTQWRTITPPGSNAGYSALAVNPCNADELLVAPMDLRNTPIFRSTDGGQSWQKLGLKPENTVPWWSSNDFLHNVASLAFDPQNSSIVWLTDWYGTYRTRDITTSPVTWTNLEKGHEEIVTFGLATPPRGFPLISAVADRDGFAHESLDTFPSKTFSADGRTGPWFQHTYSVAYCQNSPLNLVRIGGNGWNSTFWGATSADGGLTWKEFGPRENKNLLRVAMSATNPKNFVILAGESQPRVTKDGGKTFTAVQGLPNTSKGPWVWMQPLAADTVDGSTFYYVNEGRILSSIDGGSTFTATPATVPAHWNSILKAAPGCKGELWLGAREKGLFFSIDGGYRFNQIKNVTEAHLFALGPAIDDVPVVYLQGQVTGLGEGVFRSLDRGQNWMKINGPESAIGGEPNVMEASQQEAGTVFIGTNGRGIYYGRVD